MKKNFEQNVEDFRQEFLKKTPKDLVTFDDEEVDNAYKIMDEFYERTIKFEEEKRKIMIWNFY